MTGEEQINLLEKAQEHIDTAVHCIRAAVKGTGREGSVEYYIVGHLLNWSEGHNPYDETIPKLIEYIEEGN